MRTLGHYVRDTDICSRWSKGRLVPREALNFGQVCDVESPRRAELVPFNVGQGFPVLSVEHGNHFAPDTARDVARAQPVLDMVANLDFINWGTGIRHVASRIILRPYSTCLLYTS